MGDGYCGGGGERVLELELIGSETVESPLEEIFLASLSNVNDSGRYSLSRKKIFSNNFIC